MSWKDGIRLRSVRFKIHQLDAVLSHICFVRVTLLFIAVQTQAGSVRHRKEVSTLAGRSLERPGSSCSGPRDGNESRRSRHTAWMMEMHPRAITAMQLLKRDISATTPGIIAQLANLGKVASADCPRPMLLPNLPPASDQMASDITI